MKRRDVKSHCPVNFTIEIYGDPWSLLILRDMAAVGKKTFSEFLNAEERISSRILTERLKHLENKGVIAKQRDPTDGRKAIYTFTDIGLSVLPILYEVALYGSRMSPNPEAAEPWSSTTKYEKQEVLAAWRSALEAGSSFFTGDHSAAKQLGLAF